MICKDRKDAGEERMTEYAYGYCGMPCALCTRYRTEGKSGCPGCSHDGYDTKPCKAHHCCREKKRSHCGACEGFPCMKLGKMGDFSDLNTGRVKERTCNYIASHGFDAWYQGYARRADLLTIALEQYNNGHIKLVLWKQFEHDRDGYTNAKTEFVRRYTQKAKSQYGVQADMEGKRS